MHATTSLLPLIGVTVLVAKPKFSHQNCHSRVVLVSSFIVASTLNFPWSRPIYRLPLNEGQNKLLTKIWLDLSAEARRTNTIEFFWGVKQGAPLHLHMRGPRPYSSCLNWMWVSLTRFFGETGLQQKSETWTLPTWRQEKSLRFCLNARYLWSSRRIPWFREKYSGFRVLWSAWMQ